MKKDLRRLRSLTHSIEVSMQVKERHEKRLLWLKTLSPTKETLSDIEKIERILSTLNVERYISEATALENKYMEAINALDPLDKTIILDGYINGKPYWKIGRDIGYAEVSIKKRVGKIILQIANRM